MYAAKAGIKNVTECLSFCTAIRRLDYWMQSSTNNNVEVPIVDIAAGIDDEGTCWCLPQNMTTTSDIKLWSDVLLNGGEDTGTTTTTTTTTSSSSSSSTNLAENSFNDIFLPPSCCDASANSMLTKPGATYVNTSVPPEYQSVSCPITSLEERRTGLISIFESSYSCGISTTCMEMSGCVRHYAFKPPSGYVASFDSCVPLVYPPDGHFSSNSANYDDSIDWDVGSILRIVGMCIIALLFTVHCIMTQIEKRKERAARERLLIARGDFGGATTNPVNISSLISPSNNNNSGAAAAGGSRRRRRYPGENDDGNNNGAGNQSQELESKTNNNTISLEEMQRQRKLLNKLPTSALASRSLEVCRLMASTIVQAALNTKMTEKAEREQENLMKNNQQNNINQNCSLCLETLTEAPQGSSDEAVARLPFKITLPECGHTFHTLCFFRQLVFHAQKMDQFEAEKQQMQLLEKLNEKEGFVSSSASAAASSSSHHQNQPQQAHRLFNPTCAICKCCVITDPAVLDQVESLATGKKLVVISSNPLQ